MEKKKKRIWNIIGLYIGNIILYYRRDSSGPSRSFGRQETYCENIKNDRSGKFNFNERFSLSVFVQSKY